MYKGIIKRIAAVGLGVMLAFSSGTLADSAAYLVTARASETELINVTYNVQVYQSDVSEIYSNIKKTDNSAISESELRYNSGFEKLAVERAKDLALYYDKTRPDSKAPELITDDGNTGNTSNFLDEEIADSKPTWTVDTSKYNACGIGHVKFKDKDYYSLVLGKSDQPAALPDNTLTGYTDVKRQIIRANVSGIYAVYDFRDGSADSGSTVFTGNTATCDKTMSLSLGTTREAPYVTYSVKTTSGGENTYAIQGASGSLKAQSGSYYTINGNRVTGNSIGKGSYLSYTANIAGDDMTFNVPLEVTQGNLSDAAMSLAESRTYYATGKAITPKVNLSLNGKTLTEGVDYKLTYSGNTAAATITAPQTATITAAGQGNYTGSKSITFMIQPSTGGNLSDGSTRISLDPSEKTPIVYDGKEKKPKVVVTYHDAEVPASAYDIAYSDNINAGKMTVTVTAKALSSGSSQGSGTVRQYSGSAKASFDITPLDLSTAVFTFKDSDSGQKGSSQSSAAPTYSYTGGPITPEPEIKVGSTVLKAGTDFTYSYSNNKAIGTGAVVTVTGKGNYTGTASKSFEITKGNISKATVTLTPSSPYTYNGSRQYPNVVVVQIGGNTLRLGTDYTISAFPDSVNAGDYSFTITGINNFKGTASSSTGSSTGSTGSSTSQNSTNTGILTVSYTIEAKDAGKLYKKTDGISVSGLKTITYDGKTHKPAISVIDNAIAAELGQDSDYTRADSDNKTPGTAKVTLTFKGNYTGTITATYKIVPKKTTIKKVSAGKKKATVKFNKVSGISGYQVKAGTNKSVSKGTKTKTTNKTSYTMKSLKKGKRYYFKVRTYYQTANGKKIYSSWSGVKSTVVK
ncbi:MAG: hypothetical protein PUF90_06960 [Lachnospiraceae bacterium]|nr:hypothetical protein [Lachnospiraceae bacterium]